MSTTTWGVTATVAAAIIAVVFAASQGLFKENGTTPEAGDEQAASQANDTSALKAPQTQKSDTREALEAEAESYVERLGEPTDEPLQLGSAEGFAPPDQPVASREDDTDASAGADMPGDGDGSGAASASGETAGDEPGTGFPERTEVEASRAPGVTAEAEPADAELVAPADATGSTESGSADTDDGGTGPSDGGTPRIDLPLTEESPVTLADLIGPAETIPSDAVLYVHTVTPRDNEGIWGIIHEGILENFARGVAVHRGESTETYQVDIPEDADQLRPDNSSSFLGRLIHKKTRQSYVYNYDTERIGRNPDLILPGEEIVIVSFTPEELVSVYKHFVSQERADET